MNITQIPQEIVNRMNHYSLDRRNLQDARQDRIIHNLELQTLIEELSSGIGE